MELRVWIGRADAGADACGKVAEIRAAWVEFDRGIGRPTRVRYHLREESAEQGAQMRTLKAEAAKILASGGEVVLASEVVSHGSVVPPCVLESIVDTTDIESDQTRHTPALELVGVVTSARGPGGDDLHTPRWRVHACATADELIEVFSHVAKPTGAVTQAISGKDLRVPNTGTKPISARLPTKGQWKDIGTSAATSLGGAVASGGFGAVPGAALGEVKKIGSAIDVTVAVPDQLAGPLGGLADAVADKVPGLDQLGLGIGFAPSQAPVVAQIVQAGASDLEFLQQALGALYHQHGLPRLVISGGRSDEPDSEDARILTFACPDEAAANGQLLPSLPEEAGFTEGWEVGSEAFAHVPGSFQAEGRPSPRYVRERNSWAADAWMSWRDRGLPWSGVTGQDTVWRVVDRIATSGDAVATWKSTMYLSPPAQFVPGVDWSADLPPGIATGTVKSSNVRSGVIDVKLDGFDDDKSVIKAFLSTPYSGYDGKTGLHFVPEQGSRVAIAWSGRTCSLPTVIGNLRAQVTTRPAPMLELERKLELALVDVRVERVGKVTVESELNVELQKQTAIREKANARVTIDKDLSLHAEKGIRLSTKDKLSAEIGGDADMRVDGKTTVSGSDTVRMASNKDTEFVGGGVTATLKNGRMDVG